MSNLIIELREKKLINPPRWLDNNLVYLTICGSIAYGTENTNVKSDFDTYGICIPPKKDLFPHLNGCLYGFDKIDSFQQYQEHHIVDESALGGRGREYDISIYNIVKYFKLLMDNNPSCIDVLFTPTECILHSTKVGNLIRDNRKLFLHKGCWSKFKGYAYSMLHKMNSKSPKENSKRYKLREDYGFDVKFAMHTVRLLLECEQILLNGDLDLRKDKEHLKSIRRGEVTEKEIRDWASEKEKGLEKIYETSKLQHSPDEAKIKALLLNCLEEHYGNLEACIVNPEQAVTALKQIQEILEKNKNII